MEREKGQTGSLRAKQSAIHGHIKSHTTEVAGYDEVSESEALVSNGTPPRPSRRTSFARPTSTSSASLTPDARRPRGHAREDTSWEHSLEDSLPPAHGDEDTSVPEDDEILTFETPCGPSVDAAHVGTAAASNLGASTSVASKSATQSPLPATSALRPPPPPPPSSTTAAPPALPPPPPPRPQCCSSEQPGRYLPARPTTAAGTSWPRRTSRSRLCQRARYRPTGRPHPQARLRPQDRKSKFRIVHIDIGDGKKTHMYVDNDSDLYRFKTRRCVPSLHDVSGSYSPVDQASASTTTRRSDLLHKGHPMSSRSTDHPLPPRVRILLESVDAVY